MRERAQSSRSSSSQSQGAPDGASRLVVGRIGRAVGLKGEVDLVVISDDPKRFASGSVVLTREARRLTVRNLRRQGQRTIVSFAEVGDRAGAEALQGAELVVPIAEARALEEGEYWDHDLVGCAVVTSDGEEIGIVTDVLHQPANEVLVIVKEGRQILVPLISEVVKRVDPQARITIEPPPE